MVTSNSSLTMHGCRERERPQSNELVVNEEAQLKPQCILGVEAYADESRLRIARHAAERHCKEVIQSDVIAPSESSGRGILRLGSTGGSDTCSGSGGELGIGGSGGSGGDGATPVGPTLPLVFPVLTGGRLLPCVVCAEDKAWDSQRVLCQFFVCGAPKYRPKCASLAIVVLPICPMKCDSVGSGTTLLSSAANAMCLQKHDGVVRARLCCTIRI